MSDYSNRSLRVILPKDMTCFGLFSFSVHLKFMNYFKIYIHY